VSATARHALVTGGAGFIGSHLVRALLDRGLAVTVLDNLSVGTRAAVDPRARLVDGDVRDRTAVGTALEHADCVVHLAAQVTIRASFERFYDDVDTNLMGTLNLARCLDAQRVRRVVLASSMGVYADAPSPEPIAESHPCEPIAPYGVSKLAAERICAQILVPQGIGVTALRYFNTYGPGQTFSPYVGVITIFITKLLQGQPPTIFGDGEQSRDFIHVADVVAGTIAALDGPPGVYNLGTGRATSVNALARFLIDRVRPGLDPVYAPAQPGELRFSIADGTAARERLGFEPRCRLDTSIDAVIDAIRRRLASASPH